MRAAPSPSLSRPDPAAANCPALRWPALVSLLVGCTAALAIPLLLSRALPAQGEPPSTQAPSVAAPSEPGDTSVPDAGKALRNNGQWDPEAPPTF